MFALALLYALLVPGYAWSQPAEEALLDVGVVIFDPGIPEDRSTHSRLGIFPEIRKSEAKYMAVLLRQVLMDSGEWGVVRVLPEPQASSEVLVTGSILHSDGLRLEFVVRVSDAVGRAWFERTYRREAGEADYPVASGGDPFLPMYVAIASDMLSSRDALDARQLRAVRDVGVLRYAASLAPEVFGTYLARDEQGRYSAARLPAEDDPMMARVQRIRNQEHLFIDTVDEQYARLREDMAPTYHLWRQYGQEQALFRADYEARAAERERGGRRGSFVALQQTYNTYKGLKIQEQDLDELAQGFNNEVAPTDMDVQGRVVRLSGTLESQYREWREILRRIFALETGLPPT